jgi:hypothetical protein
MGFVLLNNCAGFPTQFSFFPILSLIERQEIPAWPKIVTFLSLRSSEYGVAGGEMELSSDDSK